MSARFFEAMRFVEDERAFPVRTDEVHGERFAALLEELGLRASVQSIPSIVVAGSAGKASKERMIASVARAALDRAGDRRPIVLGTKPPLRETPDGHRQRYQILRAGFATRIDPAALAASWADACWIDRDRFVDQVDVLRAPTARLEARIGVTLAPYDCATPSWRGSRMSSMRRWR